jgi:hypothetical protein
MGRTFSVVEPAGQNVGLLGPFRCGEGGSDPIEIFRLLTGSVDVTSAFDDRSEKLRINHLSGRLARASTSNEKLTKSLFGEDVSIHEAQIILEKLKTIYPVFFGKLKVELVHCLVNYARKNYIESFVHFFRSLEKMAVAFPIMYITSRGDFEEIHKQLKPLFINNNDGELIFVNRFCKKLAESSDYLEDYKIEFSFDKSDPEIQDVHVREIKRVCSEKIGDGLEEEATHVRLKYEMAADLIIECRNKLFHNGNSGQRNLDVDRIGGASKLCKGLLDGGLHWLAITYVEVVRNRSSQLGV